jgi:hypothetical protein
MTGSRNVNSVHDLVGETVDTVCFVADYVELDFAGPIVRFLLYPVTIGCGSSQVNFPEAGSRDALCLLIGRAVTGVDLSESALVLSFDESTVVTARIDEADARGPESVQFVPWENGRPNVAAMDAW